MTPQTLQVASQIAVLIGVILTGLGGFGAYYFGSQVELEKERASDASERPLKAKITELLDSNRIIRPRVGVVAIVPSSFEVGAVPSLVVAVANTGGDTAQETRVSITAAIWRTPDGIPSAPAHPSDIVPEPFLPGVVHEYRMFPNAAALTEEHSSGIKDGTWAVWIVGLINYRDSAGGEHESEFCLKYDAIRGGFPPFDPARNRAD